MHPVISYHITPEGKLIQVVQVLHDSDNTDYYLEYDSLLVVDEKHGICEVEEV